MHRIGVLRCLLAAVLFGVSTPAAAELAGSIPTFTLAGLLYVGAAVAVVPSVVRRPPSRAAVRAEWRPTLGAVVAGGALGPLLLVGGLARTDAATASLLLNAELAATAVLAAVFFGEHLGRRVVVAVVLITAAGVLLTWAPGAGLDTGAVLVVAACVCWGWDNGVTAAIERLTPEQVVAAKGVVAGGANLAIGLSIAGVGADTTAADVVVALVVGAAGYGWSITLWVRGARDLGAARAQVIFSVAPFVGAGVAWVVLGDPATARQLAAVVLATAGVAVSLRSGHEHEHEHVGLLHEHDRVADDHHEPGLAGRGGHLHRHRRIVHRHPHVPDLHHRHDHRHDHRREHGSS